MERIGIRLWVGSRQPVIELQGGSSGGLEIAKITPFWAGRPAGVVADLAIRDARVGWTPWKLRV